MDEKEQNSKIVEEYGRVGKEIIDILKETKKEESKEE